MRSSARGWSRLVHPAVVIILTAVVIGIPLWLALVTSAKSQGEANLPDLSLPRVWHLWDNYSQAFTQGRMLWALFGSLLVMVPSVAGMMLVYMGMYMSLVIFFVAGFVRTIPVEVEEAARMDGARPLGIFIKVVLPLLRPVIATATILICLYIWNDVFYAFFVLGGGTYSTLPLNLYPVASSNLYQNNWNLVFAYVVLMSLPLVVVFVVAQRRIISGITGGAVK